MFERPQGNNRAVLVRLGLGTEVDEEETREFVELVQSAGASVAALITGRRRAPDPRYFVGSGKAEEIRAAVVDSDAGLVIIDHALSPSQERNLERLLNCRVLDRAGLILDIFASRARSFEGKLQVELAQLGHLSTRLVRGWSHLERQKGGIGLRGPGETQLETDRRLLGNRIKMLRRRLDKVASQREQGRRTRLKASVPTISLVGYTNAGKSTLFNRLTGAEVYAADKLFATLDPTLRGLALPGGTSAVLVDTVGFIRDLPHELVAAFRATLQETREASLLLHVVDSNDPEHILRAEQVQTVVEELGAGSVPQIEVFNKCDLSGRLPGIETDADGRVRRVWVSATTGAGLDDLITVLADVLNADRVTGLLRLKPESGRARAKLYALGAVQDDHVRRNGGWRLQVDVPLREWQSLCRSENLDLDAFDPLPCLSDSVSLQSVGGADAIES